MISGTMAGAELEKKETSLPSDAVFPKALSGKLKFDLQEVNDPNFGPVRIAGEFPRISARYRREVIDFTTDVGELKSELRNFASQFFDVKGQPSYFEGLIDTSVIYAVCIDPFHPVGSCEIMLEMKTYFWLWVLDDVIESSIINKVAPQVLENGFNHLLSLLKNSDTDFKDVQGFSNFPELVDALKDLLQDFHSLLPDFKELSGPLRYCLRRYFEAMRWFAVKNIDKNYSAETFQGWRKFSGLIDGSVEISFLIEGRKLPKKILKSPSFGRYIDLVRSIGVLTNDVLGIRKELEEGIYDSIVVFKVVEKGVPLQVAAKETVAAACNAMSDLILLRDSLLLEFDCEPNLVRYIDIVETLLDGNMWFYVYAARYKAVGQVSMHE